MGGTVPPCPLILRHARRTRSRTQPLPFLLLERPLSFLRSNSSFRLQPNLEPSDSLWAGLVPPFCDFFNAVLSHYQIHMMHLGPESITLLSVFAFVCEAMMGILPSVALLRHFFSLHLVDPTQCSGCVSLIAAPETAASGIDFSLPPPAPGFRERWLYVDVGVPSPC